MQKAILLLSLLAAIQVRAEYGAVTAGTAGSGRAALDAGDTPLLNPGGIGFLNGYFLNTSYSTLNLKEGSGSQFLFGITDNSADTKAPTSLSYMSEKRRSDAQLETETKTGRLSMGGKANRWLSLGAGLIYKQDMLPGMSYQQTNLVLGLLASANRDFGIGIVTENVLKSPTSLPEAYRLDRKTAVGISYAYWSTLRFKADVISDSHNGFKRPTLAVGFESYLNNWIVFRAGTQRNYEIEASGFGTGMSFMGPKFALHYGYQKMPETEELTRHTVDLSIPIW